MQLYYSVRDIGKGLALTTEFIAAVELGAMCEDNT